MQAVLEPVQKGESNGPSTSWNTRCSFFAASMDSWHNAADVCASRFAIWLALFSAACSSAPGAEPAVSPAGPSAEAPAGAPSAEAPKSSSEAGPAPGAGPDGYRAPKTLEPLSDELRDALAAIRPDPAPRAITRQRHYIISNENKHYLWRDAVSGLGGIHLGVGAEQNYLLAGWARSEILVLMDFDQWIADLNEIYGLLFRRAETTEDFLELWSVRSRQRVIAWIDERWPERRERIRHRKVFDGAQIEVRARLERLKKRHERRGIRSFLNDAQQYGHIRQLWQLGRVRSVRGDLTQSMTVRDVAMFSRRSNIPVRVAYMSNAEDYFDYDRGSFRANFTDLPWDARSLVLRTKPRDGHYYRFVVQSGENFRAWLESRAVESIDTLMDHAVPAGGDDADLVHIVAQPTAAAGATAER